MTRKNIDVDNRLTQQSDRYGALKWTIVFLFVIGGIVANSYFSNVAWAVRLAIGIVLFVVSLVIASQTEKGRIAWSFMKGARIELHKVVWPTRHETVQTTLIVVAMVVFAALVLWGLDHIFFWLVGWLTGQR